MNRLTQYRFIPPERQELDTQIRAKMGAAGFDAALVTGSSAITYLSSGIVFPYLDQRLVHPVALWISFETQERALVCTFDLSDIPAQLGWEGDVVMYELTEESPEQALAIALKRYLETMGTDISAKRIGYDLEQTSSRLYNAFDIHLPSHQAAPIDETLKRWSADQN